MPQLSCTDRLDNALDGQVKYPHVELMTEEILGCSEKAFNTHLRLLFTTTVDLDSEGAVEAYKLYYKLLRETMSILLNSYDASNPQASDVIKAFITRITQLEHHNMKMPLYFPNLEGFIASILVRATIGARSVCHSSPFLSWQC